jgi:hypothetical protein
MNGFDIMKFAGRITVLLSVLVALSACKAFDTQPPPPCPRISILGDAAKLTRFRPGPGRTAADAELTAELSSFHGSCTYDAAKRNMTVTLQVGIDAALRPAAKEWTADLSYFIALPVFYPNPNAKRVIPVYLEFSSGDGRVHYTDDEVEVSFPVLEIKELAKYEVIVGLQLTPEQVEYNRQRKTMR